MTDEQILEQNEQIMKPLLKQETKRDKEMAEVRKSQEDTFREAQKAVFEMCDPEDNSQMSVYDS